MLFVYEDLCLNHNTASNILYLVYLGITKSCENGDLYFPGEISNMTSVYSLI